MSQWQNFHVWVNYPFNDFVSRCDSTVIWSLYE